MKARERILAIGVVGAIGVWAGVSLFNRMVVRPFETQKKAIADTRREIAKLKQMKAEELAGAEERWRALTARTLDLNPGVAQRRFIDDLSKMLERHGFTRNDLTVKPLSIRKNKDGSTELPIAVSAKGKLKDVMGLLLDLYRRSYILRVDAVTLNADDAGRVAKPGRGRAAPADRDGPDIALSLTASTLALPKLKEIPHDATADVQELDQGRLPRPREEYDAVVAANIFAEYVPPPPPQPKVEPETTRTVAQNDQRPVAPPPPPPPDPRKDAGHFTVAGTTSLRGQPTAYIRDDRQAGETAQYALNSEIDDGVLILVHPRGIVVRSTQGDFAGTDFFYKLGANFMDRVPLVESGYPDVMAELRVALQ